MWLILSLMAFAAEPEPVLGSSVPEWTEPLKTQVAPSESVAARVQVALAHRETVRCADILGFGDASAIRDALIAGTRTAFPPWAPMRAASCLAELGPSDPAAFERLKELAADEEQPGFALVVVGALDTYAEGQAVELASVIKSNSNTRLQARLPGRLLNCRHAGVRDLAR